ncbi:hypothetical protein CC86DRAFT_287088 [Ophiobolus disseminans]|uniref:Potassium channel tetramerisation-type BTB domain-containing protein n=1 Tax=Ophiobolus disseminans TaxID=1469910 RepID=A0A6A7A8R4_9PLEO|nr:hypothetical protein CC86DRAFT_287088 [Ophiobolus disseminans]
MDVHKSAADAQDAASNHTTTSTTRYPNIMILDIGGRIFKVSRITLLESGLFRHQMSNRFTWEPEADGSYFLDADPDLFEHLLRFMRRPNIFPLFYTTCTGFDYDLYNRLENEAEYFQIEALHTWLMEKRYLRAVMLHRYQPQTRTLDDLSPEKAPISETEDMHMLPRVKQVYICPRGIGVHRGEPDKCGRACHEAQGDNDDEFEEVLYTEVVSVRKEVEFIGSVCRLE